MSIYMYVADADGWVHAAGKHVERPRDRCWNISRGEEIWGSRTPWTATVSTQGIFTLSTFTTQAVFTLSTLIWGSRTPWTAAVATQGIFTLSTFTTQAVFTLSTLIWGSRTPWTTTVSTQGIFTLSTFPLLSNRHHMSCDDCLEDGRVDYQNCSVPQLYTVISTHIWAVLSGVLAPAGLGLWLKYFVCFLPKASLFILCFFGVFSAVCFELSVPVQVIARKDSSLKWLLCAERDVKLDSLTNFLHYFFFYVVYLFTMRLGYISSMCGFCSRTSICGVAWW